MDLVKTEELVWTTLPITHVNAKQDTLEKIAQLISTTALITCVR